MHSERTNLGLTPPGRRNEPDRSCAMICADFLAGANLDHGEPEILRFAMTRFFKFLPEEQRQAFLETFSEKAS